MTQNIVHEKTMRYLRSIENEHLLDANIAKIRIAEVNSEVWRLQGKLDEITRLITEANQYDPDIINDVTSTMHGQRYEDPIWDKTWDEDN